MSPVTVAVITLFAAPVLWLGMIALIDHGIERRRRRVRQAVKPLVYIAGPYTHPDPVENTHQAIKDGLHIREMFDVAVLIPHLTMFAHLVEPRHVDYWYRFDLDQLEHCDVVYRRRGESKGADLEVAQARELGIPVVTNGRELADWITARTEAAADG